MSIRNLVLSGVAATAIWAGMSAAAVAGEQFLGDNGYAVSGYDPVAYFTESRPVAGDPAISYEHNGATFLFSSSENRDRFAADPESYAPAYDGHCAYGAAQNYKVPGLPEHWAIVDGRLYLNVSGRAQNLFDRDRPGQIEMAEANWPALEPLPRAEP